MRSHPRSSTEAAMLDAGEGGRRLSIVYFHQPDLDSLVAPAPDGPRPLPPILARDGVSDLVELE